MSLTVGKAGCCFCPASTPSIVSIQQLMLAALFHQMPSPQLLVNSDSKISVANRHHPHFHWHPLQTVPSADGSINNKRTNPTCKIARDVDRCQVAQLMCDWKQLECESNKKIISHLLSKQWRKNSNNFLKIGRSLLFNMIPCLCNVQTKHRDSFSLCEE